jgi:hypothetical protein
MQIADMVFFYFCLYLISMKRFFAIFPSFFFLLLTTIISTVFAEMRNSLLCCRTSAFSFFAVLRCGLHRTGSRQMLTETKETKKNEEQLLVLFFATGSRRFYSASRCVTRDSVVRLCTFVWGRTVSMYVMWLLHPSTLHRRVLLFSRQWG